MDGFLSRTALLHLHRRGLHNNLFDANTGKKLGAAPYVTRVLATVQQSFYLLPNSQQY